MGNEAVDNMVKKANDKIYQLVQDANQQILQIRNYAKSQKSLNVSRDFLDEDDRLSLLEKRLTFLENRNTQLDDKNFKLVQFSKDAYEKMSEM